jgi:trehalose 6-phosphate phosphatase
VPAGPGVAALLAPFLDAPGEAAILTDFDGTLSGIVEDPEQAGPVPGAAETLAHLAASYRVVGVISGRPVRFLLDRLQGIEGLRLAGLYGLEQAVGGGIHTNPDAARWASVLEEAAADAEATAPAGVRVERKGLAVTLHVRTAPQHAAWIARFGATQAAQRGLEVHPGRQSIELRPPVPVDKGTVVETMAAGCRAVCYCGDDRGDLPAFAVLDRLRHRNISTLAVAVLSDEAPPELAAAADLTVDGPAGTVDLLARLVPGNCALV